jgi:hypothetical protein
MTKTGIIRADDHDKHAAPHGVHREQVITAANSSQRSTSTAQGSVDHERAAALALGLRPLGLVHDSSISPRRRRSITPMPTASIPATAKVLARAGLRSTICNIIIEINEAFAAKPLCSPGKGKPSVDYAKGQLQAVAPSPSASSVCLLRSLDCATALVSELDRSGGVSGLQVSVKVAWPSTPRSSERIPHSHLLLALKCTSSSCRTSGEAPRISLKPCPPSALRLPGGVLMFWLDHPGIGSTCTA